MRLVTTVRSVWESGRHGLIRVAERARNSLSCGMRGIIWKCTATVARLRRRQ